MCTGYCFCFKGKVLKTKEENGLERNGGGGGVKWYKGDLRARRGVEGRKNSGGIREE
jgi:hypothetical protein